ncbi:MAG: MiaB/RimO family radical SAM methylthiotransferase [Planctomycetota bacterium]|nr:MiaB/RimO family radical SAM methylthiotransferase [Planctomycetota bacterium]
MNRRRTPRRGVESTPSPLVTTMSPLTYRITTLGCRVNHAETREMETLLHRRGLRAASPSEAADLEIVHSCSVTSAAVTKSRQAIRRAARRQSAPAEAGSGRSDGPGTHAHGSTLRPRGGAARVLVTGCYAATHGEEAATLTGDRHCVFPHETEEGSSLMDRFAGQIDTWLARGEVQRPIRIAPPGSSTADPGLPASIPVRSARGHIRAELRVQDGCDARCTFCVIPAIRRTLRSKSIPDAVEEARRLVDLGHREIVLTGIFLGAYGRRTALRRRQADRTSRDPLADLLSAVARVPGLERLRLSSLEPGDVTDPLLAAMTAHAPTVVPHLHLPLQSGSDRILRLMNRQYRVGEYLEMVDRVNAALTTGDGAEPLPPAITTDIICGFPTETDEDFARTLAVARRVNYLHMHVFPYSAMPGTPAARRRDRFVPAPVIRARVRTLIDLEDQSEEGLSMRFRRRLLGRTVRIILEQPDRVDSTLMTGRCDHYALIHLRSERPRGSLVRVRITEVTPTRTMGVPIGACDVASAGCPPRR